MSGTEREVTRPKYAGGVDRTQWQGAWSVVAGLSVAGVVALPLIWACLFGVVMLGALYCVFAPVFHLPPFSREREKSGPSGPVLYDDDPVPEPVPASEMSEAIQAAGGFYRAN